MARRRPRSSSEARATSEPGHDPGARATFLEQARRYTPYLGVDTDAGRFLVATGTGGTGWELFVERGLPEFRVLSHAVSAIEHLAGDDAITGRQFVDVGASIGTATVAALVSHRFGSAVCCEPEAENYRLLRANLVLNSVEERVRPLRLAVSHRAGPELVTLDQLVEDGVIDLSQVGLLWVAAEGHDSRILDGAGALADAGVPTVFEFNPARLEQRGDRSKLHDLAEFCYTHYVDLRPPEAEPTRRRFRLCSAAELNDHADRLLDPSTPGDVTDLLLLRLDEAQGRAGASLPKLMKRPRGQLRTKREAGSAADGDAPLIAFVHIPKTAGGTVKSMFSAAYSREAVHDSGNYLRSAEGPDAKITGRRIRQAQVTIGHVPYGLLRQHLPPDTRYLTFLREPVDRVLSYYYRHVQPIGDATDERRPFVADSIEEALEIPRPEINNLATRFLCSDPSPSGQLPATALDDAKSNLREFAFVGIQERFDESAVLLRRTFDLPRAPYESRHISPDRPSVDEIGDEQRALIEECNQLDAELYEFAIGLFDDAIAAVGEGVGADAEVLRDSSAAATRAAVRAARDWLDGELPVGTTRRVADLRAAAASAGISFTAVRYAARFLAVERAWDDEDQTWTRSRETRHGAPSRLAEILDLSEPDL